MQTALNRQEDGTINLTVTIPWQKVKESFDKFLQKALSGVEIEGFRKGKAPKKLAEEKVDQQKVYQTVVQEVIPQFYLQAINQHSLRPIITPKIELSAAQKEKDWQFKATLCERPEVKLGEYKQAIRELKIKKRTKIWVPGKENQKAKGKNQKVSLDDILDTLLKVSKIQIPEILLEDQVNRMLADLLDQIQKLGLEVEQYLKAKGKSVEQLKEEYKMRAEKNLTLEFVLEKIADEEKITVSEKEIDDLINKEKDKKVQEHLKAQKYYLASVMRRQKTIDKLLNP